MRGLAISIAYPGNWRIRVSNLNDHETQVQAVESCIASGAKGILITASDTKAIVPVVQQARDAGVLVIALDTPLEPIDAADATFATDNFKAGELIGQWAAKTLGDKAKDARVAFLDAGRIVALGTPAELRARGAGAVFRTIPSKVLSLEDLKAPKIFQDISDNPRGLVLVTGPTGSGKSTSLFSILSRLNQPSVNISTVEDPVEYRLPGVNQTQVNPVAGMTFVNGLRALLRQDPNVIMVGEIRDGETAGLAVQAALTGHLVFSTLHTGDSVGVIDRVAGVFRGDEQEAVRHQLSMVLRAVVAQRLLPAATGDGRVPAVEILRVNAAVANLIRTDRPQQIAIERESLTGGLDRRIGGPLYQSGRKMFLCGPGVWAIQAGFCHSGRGLHASARDSRRQNPACLWS